MKQTEILVQGIEYKVKKLIEQKIQLQEENISLKNEISIIQRSLSEKEATIKQLEEKIKTIQVSGVLIEDNDKIEIHQRIDELVREIDKSLSILNSLNK